MLTFKRVAMKVDYSTNWETLSVTGGGGGGERDQIDATEYLILNMPYLFEFSEGCFVSYGHQKA